MNTPEFLLISSSICPDREAIIFEGNRWSFSDLADRSNRLANALAGMGVGQGDKVGMLQVNCNECIEVYFATAKLGATYVPLNFRARAEELEFMINFSEASALFLGQRYVKMVNSMREQIPGMKNFVSVEGPAEGMLDYEAVIAEADPEEVFTDIDDNDTSILMFTAGTTGQPKGVMLTHDNLATYVLNNVSPADPDIEEKNILTVPLYHIAGMQAVLAAVYGGRTLVVQRQFDPSDWMTLVETESVTRAMMVPTMLKQLMEHEEFPERNLSSLQVITYGAAPMPVEVITKAIEVFPGTRFINAFGQTESASTITMLTPEDHVIEGTPGERAIKLKRLGSIGRALGDTEVKIFDEDGSEQPVDEVGEIVARGPRVMKGYWKAEEATNSTIRNGWLYTGDIGYMDEAGYIFLSGRAKDIIIRAGENISPEQVEATLHSHPAIDEAAVIGVPDPQWGEKVRAIVALKAGAQASEADIIEHCRGQLASFKKPESVIFVDSLPRNPLGKVLKRVLREEYGKA